jgi:flagellar biosynthesis/type III secretory pathway protein FliH
MIKPNIQINDEVREMTEEEYAELLATGWTEGEPQTEKEPNTP